RAMSEVPLRQDRSSMAGRVALEGRTIHVLDVMADADLTFYRERGGDYRRTVLGVPLTRQGATVGSVILTRAKVEPFTDKQIRLVETFADQAGIAIEKPRLFEAEQTRKRQRNASLLF